MCDLRNQGALANPGLWCGPEVEVPVKRARRQLIGASNSPRQAKAHDQVLGMLFPAGSGAGMPMACTGGGRGIGHDPDPEGQDAAWSGKRISIVPCDKRQKRLCGTIMLKQRDEIMIPKPPRRIVT